jgi:hypothetical protein
MILDNIPRSVSVAKADTEGGWEMRAARLRAALFIFIRAHFLIRRNASGPWFVLGVIPLRRLRQSAQLTASEAVVQLLGYMIRTE